MPSLPDGESIAVIFTGLTLSGTARWDACLFLTGQGPEGLEMQLSRVLLVGQVSLLRG